MIELFPRGFEEVDSPGGVELAAYTDAGGEERLWEAFGGVSAADVDEGWEERWRRFHKPTRVGPFWIGPPWEEPEADALAVVIDPGRAFGTGSHATTRLCLELLLELPRGSLLDVGCGSGVLAISAVRLGFEPVAALDNESAAVEATRQNAARNAVEIDVRLADATARTLPEADVTVANLTGELIEQVGSKLRSPLVITSGYLASERPRLAGLRPLRRREQEGWAADLHSRETE